MKGPGLREGKAHREGTLPQSPAPGGVEPRRWGPQHRKSQAWQDAGSEPSASQADPRKWRPQEATLPALTPRE